jgi:hypothetical protein
VPHYSTSSFSTTCPTTLIYATFTLYRPNHATPILADQRNTRAGPTLTGIFAHIFVTTSNDAKTMDNNYNGCRQNMTTIPSKSILYIFNFIPL